MTRLNIIATTPIQYNRRRIMPGETLAPEIDVARALIESGAAEKAPAAKAAKAAKKPPAPDTTTSPPPKK